MGMVVIQPYISVSKLKNKNKVRTLYWLYNLHKNPTKQDLLLILFLVRQQNFGPLKIQVKF